MEKVRVSLCSTGPASRCCDKFSVSERQQEGRKLTDSFV
jgi:hypothetical protein